MSPSTRYVFDGQSLLLTPVGGTPPPQGFMAASHPTTPYSVVSVSGTTFAQRTTTANRVLVQTAGHESNMLINDGGTSDFLADLTSAQVMTARAAYAAAVEANGRVTRHVALTCTPASSMTAGQNTQRLAYNAALLADPAAAGADLVVDVAAIPQLADGTNASYFSDGFGHYTQAAATLVAAALSAAGV